MDLSYLKDLSEGHDKNEILRDLMMAYGGDVWNFAYSLTRRRELADDIRQDVFVKAYGKIDTFRGVSSIKTWLFSITRNTVIDYHRSAIFRKVTLIDYIASKVSHPSAEQDYLANEIFSETWKAVMSLPVKLREVIVLFAHHQLSIAEIAAVLKISESSVKVRLHRARKKVNQILGESEADPNGGG